MKENETDDITLDNTKTTKQKTTRWMSFRKASRITGSTMYRALGLQSLKAQKQHYDKVFLGKEVSESQELLDLFAYGTSQEINALGTLLGKILPVYYPGVSYVEDGCDILPINDSFAVISGDGSGMNSTNEAVIAFEFKCPKPGKTRKTDVHYTLPVYYTTQVLSQMAAKESEQFAYISFTPESSTFLRGTMDSGLWESIWNLATSLYGDVNTTRPKKRTVEQNLLLDQLKTFAKQCEFVAEFPSLHSIPCNCTETDSRISVYGNHQSTNNHIQITSDELATTLKHAIDAAQESYQILRKPAKEVLVTVVSDLDRLATTFDTSSNAVPIQYGFSGFSLTMDSTRRYIEEAVCACYNKQMNVKAVAFDGQFAEIAIQDDNKRPLTVCRFMKKFWEGVQHLDKNKKLSTLLNLNALPNIDTAERLQENFQLVYTPDTSSIVIGMKSSLKVVCSPQNITKAIQRTRKKNDDDVKEVQEEDTDMCLLQYLPSEILCELDEEAIQILRKAGNTVQHKTTPAEEEIITATVEIEEATSNLTEQTDFEEALTTLIASKEAKGVCQWESHSLQIFKECFTSAQRIKKSFTVEELKLLASLRNHTCAGQRKGQLVNLISDTYGDGSHLDGHKATPKSLQTLTKKHIKTWGIGAVNVAYAQLAFAGAFGEWDDNNTFSGRWTLETDGGQCETIMQWYAQPTSINGHLLQPIIDPHHIFVNNRSACCAKGIPGMGIRPDAWWKVARNAKANQTGLSLEIACELRDRQSNAFAQTTFSEKVQEEMERNGDFNEAAWCERIRNWYKAIDEPGIPIKQRLSCLLEMRSTLLTYLKVGQFPSPDAYVAGLSMVQFEGILTNIDRRLQLYSMTENGSYNQRAVSSLDSETFFSAFQDYDTKGTGVLRADDVSAALGSAVCLFRQRLDSNRKFEMKTSGKTRVYQHQPVHPTVSIPESSEPGAEGDINSTSHQHIVLRTHQFDLPSRRVKNPKRTSGVITPFGKPARGAEGAHAWHKSNEEKILPHRRYGLNDDDIKLN